MRLDVLCRLGKVSSKSNLPYVEKHAVSEDEKSPERGQGEPHKLIRDDGPKNHQH